MDAVSSSSALVTLVMLASWRPSAESIFLQCFGQSGGLTLTKGAKVKTNLKFQAEVQPTTNHLLNVRQQKTKICVFLRALVREQPGS